MSAFVSAGIDEAGRGPVIGPLVLVCAVFDEDGREKIKKIK
ncbi:MAG: ribonuclease HII, partial [Candidatus Altiarchaeota archaeon]|nr:ribonuclease HII [Candidatus Altiarchaeota archaeon]